MLKKALARAGCSMAVTSLCSVVTLVVIELCVQREGFVPLLPDFLAHFSSLSLALGVYHLLSMLLSFTATYGVTWFMNYRRCRESVRRINERLAALRAQDGAERDEGV